MEELKVEERKKGTQGEINKMRKEGFIPAVIYGQKKPSVLIYVPKRELVSLLFKKIPLLSLKIGRKRESVVIKEKQRDPLRNKIIHLDFMRIALDEKIEIKVAIREIGIAQGVKEGGVLEQHIHEIDIKCPATNIPDAIDVPVEKLKIGDMLYVRDIVVHSEIEILEEKDKIVFSIVAGRKEEVEIEVKGPEIAEPELIKKKRKEEEIEE